MSLPQVVSRTEWRAAREELLVSEQEAGRALGALSAARRELPMVEIDQDYVFTGPAGKTSLVELFDGRRQLIVYHFMWVEDRNEGCPHCSLAADNVGHLAHLNAWDTTFALVSRARYEDIEPFKQRMGWDLPWFSSHGSEFNRDFGALQDGQDLPGVSVFLRDGDRVFHTYSAGPEGGMETVLGTFNYLDLTPLGRQEGEMGRLRHHDRYSG